MYEMAVSAEKRKYSPLFEVDGGAWHQDAFRSDPAARFILSKNGEVLESNDAAKRLILDQVLTVVDGLLRFGSVESNNAFQDAVRGTAGLQGGARRVILRDRMGIWRSAHLYRAEGQNAVFLTFRPVLDETVTALEALRSNFGLSAAEAKVLEGLLAGECAKSVARLLSVSEHTVRSHLRTIYAKLGVRGLTGALRFTLQLMS